MAQHLSRIDTTDKKLSKLIQELKYRAIVGTIQLHSLKKVHDKLLYNFIIYEYIKKKI